SGQPELEKEAFRLKPGEISGIVQISDKFVILYLEGFTKPVQVSRDEVKSLIAEDVHEKKMRLKMTSEFDRLKDQARIDNYLPGGDAAIPTANRQGWCREQGISGEYSDPGSASFGRGRGCGTGRLRNDGIVAAKCAVEPAVVGISGKVGVWL